MNFVQLCNEVGIWSQYNFGDQSADNPLLGVLEEIGEISHSYLKMNQSIRGTTEEHMASIADGVADAVVFLADFCFRADIVKSFVGRTMLNMDLNYNKRIFVKYGNVRAYLFTMARHVNDIFYYWDTRANVSYGIYVETLLIDLHSFCVQMGLDFGRCVEETWSVVQLRDWTQNKVDGAVTCE